MNKKGLAFSGVLFLMVTIIVVTAFLTGYMIRRANEIRSMTLDVTADQEARTGLMINTFHVMGYAEDYETITHWYQKSRPANGAERINLKATFIKFSARNESVVISYNSTVNCSNRSTLIPTMYGVEYLMQGNRHIEGLIMDEDIVLFCFESPVLVYARDVVEIKTIPMQGSPTIVERKLHPVWEYQEVQLFP